MCSECAKKDLCDGGCRELAHVMLGKIIDIDPIVFCSSIPQNMASGERCRTSHSIWQEIG